MLIAPLVVISRVVVTDAQDRFGINWMILRERPPHTA
jgi:hypothetical protein